MSDNRPYTLDKLRALPIGSRVWMDLRIAASKHTGWNTVTADGLEDARSVIDLDNAIMAVYGKTWRAWPAPPSVEDACKWPWEEVPNG